MRVLLSILVLTMFSFYGCATKKTGTTEAVTETVPSVNDQPANQGIVFDLNTDSDSGKAGPFQSVYFDYESHALSSGTKATLDANAEVLKTFKNLEVQIEGHCDERGGVQFNLALGDRRAKSVRDYLVALGIDAKRITTISFGKERPVAFGHDDLSWGKNRRANFVITAK